MTPSEERARLVLLMAQAQDVNAWPCALAEYVLEFAAQQGAPLDARLLAAFAREIACELALESRPEQQPALFASIFGLAINRALEPFQREVLGRLEELEERERPR